MDPGSEVREYAAGDTIKARMSVEHEISLGRVVAIFEHQGIRRALNEGTEAEHRIVLETTGGCRERWSEIEYDPSQPRITTVVLTGSVTANKALGEYRCVHLYTDYRGGRTIPFDLGEMGTVRFRIVEEPVTRPKATHWEYTDETYPPHREG
jgi:hypothetical protein